ncbi:DUF4838 domain-containing protein [Pseudobacter ginsenosidimutans]|uniref:Putative secreted protein (Por secretion system target) n=1 Tax=Pseudobacter ginsenosidimutans TaxID=661488 RepID=A0A4Q7N395_9BACT|nr:DUF4838 domain-containing protein [Pseudobacter ginsenosidimutans]QEC43636.1 DUF4838 domain-containing protein [Pseudobacter ginsenosidimutans]RZS75035.1 putative secreted protein (Por secretion system target) [Pseudobacter ginsenosidimutans]
MLKRFTLSAMTIFVMATASICKAQDLVIASPSQQASIYVNAGSASVSWYAALELQRCIQIMTGKTLAINSNPVSGAQIVIGTLANPLVSANAASMGLSGSNVNEEQTAVWRNGNNLFLAGKTARAALYATYTFLQDYLGVRWLWPGVSGEFIPVRSSVTVGSLAIFHTPKLPIRTLALTNQIATDYADNDAWMARNRMNVVGFKEGDTDTVTMKSRKQKGFLARIAGHNIKLDTAVLRAHPDWAALQSDGTRPINVTSHICWGHPDVQDAVADMIRGWWNDNPYVDIVHMYPVDNQLYCRDTVYCRPLGATVSTRWQNFTRIVMEKVELTHPGKRYWTYAYQGYKAVPQNDAAPFEFVGYALYEACYRHSFMSSSDATNNIPNTEVTGWLGKNVQMGIRGYEYIMFTDPMYVPLVKWEIEQMDWMKTNGLVGYMSELRPYRNSTSPENTNWNTNRINLYAAARAMWDTVNADSIVNDWNNVIYGTAGPHMRDYYKTFDTAWRNAPGDIKGYNNSPANFVDNFLSIPKFVKLNNHLRIARTTLENDVTDSALLASRNAQIALESKMLLNWQKIFNYKTERAYRYSTSVVKVTGTINWDSVPRLPAFENSNGQSVTEQTDVKMTWNTTNLVIRIVNHDYDVANRIQTATAHDDGNILTDDRIEIYLQKDSSNPAYIRFAVNAKNGTPWRYDASSKGGTNFVTSWTSSPAWSATNSFSTTDSTWTTTITIPFSAIGITPAENAAFKMQIKRGRPEGNSGWPDGSFYNQNNFAEVKLVNEITDPLFNKIILYDQGSANRFPISVEFQKRNWQVSSGVTGETELNAKLDEDAAVLLIKYFSTGISLSNSFFQNQITDFVSKGRLVVISGSNVPINTWFTGLPSVAWSSATSATRETVFREMGQWLTTPNNINVTVRDGMTPSQAYTPSAGWRKLATASFGANPDRPYLLTYQIGDGLLVLTSSSLGYSGGFEMFGSATPLNTVKLVENLRALQDSIHNYSLNATPPPIASVYTVQKQSDQLQSFKVLKAENSSVHLLVNSKIAEEAWLRITDISGRVISAEKVKLEKGINTVRIPASIINGNVYIAAMNMNGQTQTVKFLKK